MEVCFHFGLHTDGKEERTDGNPVALPGPLVTLDYGNVALTTARRYYDRRSTKAFETRAGLVRRKYLEQVRTGR
jgi:hypothetical protein